MKKRDFDQNAYWIQRHERFRNDPRSVGNLSKTLEQNIAAEKQIQRWVGCAARVLKPYASVLDVGCGYGRVAGVFCNEGYEYTGIDVSSVAVEAARKIEPRGSYVVGSALDADFPRRFDLVSVLYVFVHFVNDDDWRKLIARLVGMLNDGGGLLFADSFPTKTLRPAPHVTQKPLAAYESIFRTLGMKLDSSFRDRLASALGTGASLPPVYLARKLP
ncbi:MAG: class I SAM-dependent methyltransferase [Chloroflexota bacterium]